MDGNIAPLPAICDLAEEYDALVMIDECHATGFLGKVSAAGCSAWPADPTAPARRVEPPLRIACVVDRPGVARRSTWVFKVPANPA
jgi:hypothetical protein